MPDPKKDTCCGLRVGQVAAMYYKDILEMPVPSQLTVLSDLYPGLLVEEVPSDGNRKLDAVFEDASGMIRAVRYRGKLYAGASSRVSQITARLMGTARSGIEKERRTAADLQIRIAKGFAEDPDSLIDFWNVHLTRIESWPEERILRAAGCISAYAKQLMEGIDGSGLFPMDAEVSAELAGRVAGSLLRGTMEGLVDAWIWILLGALLRNEIRRLLYRYRADFSLFSDDAFSDNVSSDDMSPDSAFSDNVSPDDASEHKPGCAPGDGPEYVYEGSDMQKRFPGIEWYCDRCGARLDHQEGFHDFVHIWKCSNCGFKNRIEIDEIYDSEEDYQEGKASVDPAGFYRALKMRTDELDGEN